jgi:hypothetical protein
MFGKLLFSCLSENNQIDTLRHKGTVLRNYIRNGRMVYLYLLDNFYVEVTFLSDDTELSAEKISIYQSMEELGRYQGS